jgi:hypothetical protein
VKLKLFGSSIVGAELIALTMLQGGYDAETGRVVLVVRNDTNSGTLSLDVTESRALLALLNANIPTVEKVEAL